MTIAEFNLLMQGVKLREVDKDFRNHYQAFLNYQVQATKSAGKNKLKPVYDCFDKFYDYEKEIKKARGITVESRFSGLSKYLKEGGNNGTKI